MKKTISFLAAAATLVAMIAGCSMFGMTASKVKVGGIIIDWTTGQPIVFSSEDAIKDLVVEYIVAGTVKKATVKATDALEATYSFNLESTMTAIVRTSITGYADFAGSVLASSTVGEAGDWGVNLEGRQIANIGLIPDTWLADTNPYGFTITIKDEDTDAAVSGATVTIEASAGQALSLYTSFSPENYGTMLTTTFFTGIGINGSGEVTHAAVSETSDTTGLVTVAANTLYKGLNYVITVTMNGYRTYVYSYAANDLGNYELHGLDSIDALANIDISLDPNAELLNAFPFDIVVKEDDTDVPLSGASVAIIDYETGSAVTLTTSTTDSDGVITIPANTVSMRDSDYDGTKDDVSLTITITKDSYITFEKTYSEINFPASNVSTSVADPTKDIIENDILGTVYLEPSAVTTNNAFRLQVLVSDINVPLSGATIALADERGNAVTLTTSTTDSEGMITIPAGVVSMYDGGDAVSLTVSMTDYITYKGTINVSAATEVKDHTTDSTGSDDTLPVADLLADGTIKLEPTTAKTTSALTLVSKSWYSNEGIEGPGTTSITYTFDKDITLAPGVNYQPVTEVVTVSGADWTWKTGSTGVDSDWSDYNSATDTKTEDVRYLVAASGKTLTITVYNEPMPSTRTSSVTFTVQTTGIGLRYDGVPNNVYTSLNTIISSYLVENVTWDSNWTYDNYDEAAQ